MPALERNQQFERYRIMQWLGNGVSGESYEAVDTMLQRKVTLKLIHPWSTLPDSGRRQFFREMQGISMLNHPFLATTLDYGEIDGRLYVVRRYLSNGSLLSNQSRLWFKPPLDVEDAIHYGHQLAQALDYIHQHGYLHGALTLSNILVLRGPNLDHEPGHAPFLLADVGLSNFVRRFGQPQITLLPVTAAPEQIGQRVTPASDQFALAVLLYFWLAGRPPYLGTPQETELAKLRGTFPPLFSLNTDITYEQEEVLRRALNIYPEDRYPSVATFADALLATLTPPTTTAPLSPSPIATPSLHIEWSSGGETRVYLLEHKEILLGHAGSDDVLLDQDSSTSRHHALLKYEDEQYVIYDQRSANGVFVNGEKLNDAIGRALINGDHILIGNYELIFHC
jgi:serine/threonine protein kinase